MALQAKYQQYLANPAPDAIAPDASLHYIPSTTSIADAASIIKHLKRQAEQVKAKHNFVNVVESASSLSVESETTLRFETGGGAYLPGLDDNFLADKVVTLPLVHFVSFDGQQKITQVRLYWDQGSLLKSIDIIGARGKNWPISEAHEQIRVLTTSAVATVGRSLGSTSLSSESERPTRPQVRGGANADKHTSLSLFAPREYEERSESPSNPINPRASAKPPQRDYYDLFSGGAAAEDLPNQPPSPSKEQRNPLKSGAGKNYLENRLFDRGADEGASAESPEKTIKTNPQKYNHFEFGETAIQPDPSKMAKHNKHASKWDFADFVTPEKPKPTRQYAQQERHFGWSDDEEEASKPTVHRSYVPQARPDAQPHFDFNDDATPRAADRGIKPRMQNDKMGLYEDHVIQTEDQGSKQVPGDKGPLSNVTNTNIKGHQKTFSSQFEMSDVSPSVLDKVKNENNISENRKKVARGMQANWEMQDDSPNADANARPKQRGINIQGDGMGGRKTPGEKPWWEYE